MACSIGFVETIFYVTTILSFMFLCVALCEHQRGAPHTDFDEPDGAVIINIGCVGLESVFLPQEPQRVNADTATYYIRI